MASSAASVPFSQVILEILVRELLVRIHPRDDEYREAFLSGPAQERILFAQVEDVVLVDPRRNHQQRALPLLLRRRLVLDELHELVLEHDLAGRGGDVDAELEGLGVGHRDLELAVAALDVVQQVVQALHQVLAAGGDRLAKHLGIGQREIRRRQRVDILAREEIDFPFRVLVEALDVSHFVVQPARRDEVALLDVVEEEMLVPVLVLETLVALCGNGDGIEAAPHHPHHRPLPQVHVIPPQVHLRLGETCRIREHLCRDFHEGLAEPELVGGQAAALAGVARREFADHLGAFFRGGGERCGQCGGIVGGRRFGNEGGHRAFSWLGAARLQVWKRMAPSAATVRRMLPRCHR